MGGVLVRELRRGEEEVWYAVHEAGTRRPFTADPAFRPEEHLVAEADGVPVGRVEALRHEPGAGLLIHPLVAPGAQVAAVSGALVAAAVATLRRRGAETVDLLLHGPLPGTEELRALAPSWGFEPARSKAFLRADASRIAWDAAPLPEGLRFRGATDDELVSALGRVLHGSYEADDDPALLVRGFRTLCAADGCLHREDWEVLDEGGRAVGVVFPAFADASGAVGTNLHVGLAPEVRGRGLGAAVHLRGLETLRRRGAGRFIGSTDARNAPMLRVFARLGYVHAATQYLFRLR